MNLKKVLIGEYLYINDVEDDKQNIKLSLTFGAIPILALIGLIVWLVK